MMLQQAEYPGARLTNSAWGLGSVTWSPNRVTPAAPRKIRRVVMHITDGGDDSSGTVRWFAETKSRVSAHFVIGRLAKPGRDGDIWQCVPLGDIAWHVNREVNEDSIGIEHVARRDKPVNADQYRASAHITRWLCDRYGIPFDRSHIIGHNEADPKTSHAGCPSDAWNWDWFLAAAKELS